MGRNTSKDIQEASSSLAKVSDFELEDECGDFVHWQGKGVKSSHVFGNHENDLSEHPAYKGVPCSRKDLFHEIDSSEEDSGGSSDGITESEIVEYSDESEQEDTVPSPPSKEYSSGDIKRQLKEIESVYKARIYLQKILVNCNRLPTYRTFSDFMDENQQITNDMTDCLRTILHVLSLFQHERLRQLDVGVQSADIGDINGLWKHIEETTKEIHGRIIDPSLEEWWNKTRLDFKYLSRPGYKTTRKGIIGQIEYILKDQNRNLKRSTLDRNNIEILDFSFEQFKNQLDPHLYRRCEEIFDDTDFYQNLLKDIIHSKTGTDQKRTEKINPKPIKDAKGYGKGKRISYATHEPLANFMSSTNRYIQWDKEKIESVYLSLPSLNK